jgi:(5-formylfuran-3-yl)methyl phosphate synthase
MRLLVSVADSVEASTAVAGGADVIDAKNPLAGALGAVSIDVLREIHAAVAGRRFVTAAIGDAVDEDSIEHAARMFAEAGAALVKVGFGGVARASRVLALIQAAVRGAHQGNSGVVAVAYADADSTSSLPPDAILELAVGTGAAAVLLDTADKNGPGLADLVTPAALTGWVADAHQSGLLVALAGKLSADHLALVRDAGADIAGVRGAACDTGRTGPVSADKIRLLKSLCAPDARHSWEIAGLSADDRIVER